MVMADPLEPDAGDDVVANETDGNVEAEPTRPARSGLRSLDRRTIGICVCVAVLFALVAGLVTAKLTEDDGTTNRASLSSAKVNTATLLATKVRTVAGTPTTFRASLTGKPVLVNFWSQSCGPCKEEMPLLEQVHQTDKRIDVLGVDTLDRVDLAKVVAKRRKITYPWIVDLNGDLANAAKSVLLPTSLLLDAKGKVLASKIGAFDDRAAVDAWIAKHLP